jgi:hypothetical protein
VKNFFMSIMFAERAYVVVKQRRARQVLVEGEKRLGNRAAKPFPNGRLLRGRQRFKNQPRMLGHFPVSGFRLLQLEHIQFIIVAMALVVRRIDATKGRGLFALRAFQQGEIVLAQPPLVFWRKPQTSHACAICLSRSIRSVPGCPSCSACSTDCSSQYQQLLRDVWCECQFSDKTPRFALMAARLMLDSFVHSTTPSPPRAGRPAAPAARPISTTPNDLFHISDDACFEIEPAAKLWWASQLCFAKLNAFESGADDGGIGDVHRRFIAVMSNKLKSTPEQYMIFSLSKS